MHEILAPGEQRTRSFSLEVPISAIDVVIPDGADFEPFGKVTGLGKLADFRVLAYAWETQQYSWTQEDFAPIVAVDEQPLWDLALHTHQASIGSMQLYPNPASDWIMVVAEKAAISKWELIDLSGRVLMNGLGNSTASLRLNVSDMKAGTYWLRCQTSQGQVLTQPFVKASF